MWALEKEFKDLREWFVRHSVKKRRTNLWELKIKQLTRKPHKKNEDLPKTIKRAKNKKSDLKQSQTEQTGY